MNKEAYIRGYLNKSAGLLDILANKFYGGRAADIRSGYLDKRLAEVRKNKAYKGTDIPNAAPKNVRTIEGK